MFKIVKKRVLTPVTKLYEVEAPLVARKAQPGQFVVIRVSETGERIPLTVAAVDPKAGTVTIVVQEVGKTSSMLGRLEAGQSIMDFAGPLGKPAPLLDSGHVVVIGGGFGVAPILPIAKALKARGVRVTGIVGARTKDLLILLDELRESCTEVLTCTDDGSSGKQGLVTDVLKDLIGQGVHIDQVIAIGPMVMMRAVSAATLPFNLKTLVSLDPIMVDGTGMCGACRCTVEGKTKFACVDGPIFDAHKVDFDEAVRRGKMYAAEQRLAFDRYKAEVAK